MSEDPKDIFAMIAAWIFAVTVVSCSSLWLVWVSVECGKLMGL